MEDWQAFTCGDCGYWRAAKEEKLMFSHGKCEYHNTGAWLGPDSPACASYTRRTARQKKYDRKIVYFVMGTLLFFPISMLLFLTWVPAGLYHLGGVIMSVLFPVVAMLMFMLYLAWPGREK